MAFWIEAIVLTLYNLIPLFLIPWSLHFSAFVSYFRLYSDLSFYFLLISLIFLFTASFVFLHCFTPHRYFEHYSSMRLRRIRYQTQISLHSAWPALLFQIFVALRIWIFLITLFILFLLACLVAFWNGTHISVLWCSRRTLPCDLFSFWSSYFRDGLDHPIHEDLSHNRLNFHLVEMVQLQLKVISLRWEQA